MASQLRAVPVPVRAGPRDQTEGAHQSVLRAAQPQGAVRGAKEPEAGRRASVRAVRQLQLVRTRHRQPAPHAEQIQLDLLLRTARVLLIVFCCIGIVLNYVKAAVLLCLRISV